MASKAFSNKSETIVQVSKSPINRLVMGFQTTYEGLKHCFPFVGKTLLVAAGKPPSFRVGDESNVNTAGHAVAACGGQGVSPPVKQEPAGNREKVPSLGIPSRSGEGRMSIAGFQTTYEGLKPFLLHISTTVRLGFQTTYEGLKHCFSAGVVGTVVRCERRFSNVVRLKTKKS